MYHGMNGDGASTPSRVAVDRHPPQNMEAEQGLLGSIMLDADCLDDVALIVAPNDFYRDSHAELFRLMVDMRSRGIPIDALTLADELTRLDLFKRFGGEEFLAELHNAPPHSANATYYAKIVYQKATSRRVADASNESLAEVYSNTFTGDELLDAAERRVYAIRESRATGETVRVADVMGGVIELVERRMAGEVIGLTTGLSDLDDVVCGLQPENLIYIAGRTSMGKTALALTMVSHLSINCRVPGLYVSVEMSRQELGERLAVMRSNVDGQQVRQGRLSRDDFGRLKFAANEVATAPLWIDDTPSRNATQICANARRLKAREGIQYIVVDLINRVEGENSAQSRREQMGEISGRLKGLARELKIPVLTLAQLNRQPDAREGNRPRKSDLKECGNLEEDADLVILLHRPEYYDPQDQPGTGLVIVDKNRNGPTGDVKVTYLKRFMRFESHHVIPQPLTQPMDDDTHF
jgi:replicative DNA helicase